MTLDGGRQNLSGRLYDWDAEGHLRTVRLADGGTTVATYCYDSAGRRISRTVWTGGGTAVDHVLRFVWDGDRVVEEWLANPALPGDRGTLVAQYIWGAPAPNGLLAQRWDRNHPVAQFIWNDAGIFEVPNEIYERLWTHPVLDSRGNLRAVVDGSGGVLERRQTSATGRPWAVDPDTGSLTGGENRPSAYGSSLLTGHHYDPYTNWHYARHRWISPWTYARFTSHSPLTYPVAELNYEWVIRNPWDYVDLDGLNESPTNPNSWWGWAYGGFWN